MNVWCLIRLGNHAVGHAVLLTECEMLYPMKGFLCDYVFFYFFNFIFRNLKMRIYAHAYGQYFNSKFISVYTKTLSRVAFFILDILQYKMRKISRI